jgi:hypothetical protein
MTCVALSCLRARLQPCRKQLKWGAALAAEVLLPQTRPKTSRQLFAFFLLLLTLPAHAHVGNKDVFEQLNTGPYKLFVTIRTPTVIPGIATVEVRAADTSPHVASVRIAPAPLTGEGSTRPPTPDAMQPSAADPAFFTGSLWLMASGSWQVRLQIEGAAGPATAGVPVAAVPLSVLPLQRPLGLTLAGLGLILVLGMAGIVAAAVRESRLAPGLAPTPARRRSAAIAGAVTLLVMAAALYLGDNWWNVEAAAYSERIYHPSDLHATLTGNTLDLTVGNLNIKQGRWKANSLDGLLPDHGHLMHLYAIREPQMDAAFHLHPAPASKSDKHLTLTLPTMPPGQYKLFADIVRLNGFPETLTATLTVPASKDFPGIAAGFPDVKVERLGPEDASAFPPPLSSGDLGPAFHLPDGYTMLWDRPANIAANTPYTFRFHLLDPAGHPASDMRPYLGMAGHAAFVKSDFTTFAHTHPDGSAAMPAMMLANQPLANQPLANQPLANQPLANQPLANSEPGMASMADMPGLPGTSKEVSSEVSSPPKRSVVEGPASSAATPLPLSSTVDFPYGFPSPGRYRIFIQMKHAATVETGVFDAEVH